LNCGNQALQQQIQVPLEVKTGSHGLGTFALRTIPKLTFIGEYTAEVLSNKAGYPILELYNHRGLNYGFDLNADLTLDAAFAGNETRCINDPRGPNSNVEAKTMWVNAEHRIGFYSTKKIQRGQELLLDYGEKYWLESHDQDDADEELPIPTGNEG